MNRIAGRSLIQRIRGVRSYDALIEQLLEVNRIRNLSVQQRRVESDVQAVTAALRRENIELTSEQIEVFRQLLTTQDATIEQFIREEEALESLRSPQQQYREQLEAINAVLRRNPELVAQAEDAIRNLRLSYLETQTDLSSGFERAFLSLSESLNDFAGSSERLVTNAFQNAENALVQFVTTGKLEVRDLVNSIIADLARLAIRRTITGPLAAAFAGIFGGFTGQGLGGFGEALAGGGPIRGPGTGTSDSILARVSNGEFVVNARSTRRFLPLLESINRAPRFQTGGLVRTGQAPGGTGGNRERITVNVYHEGGSGERPQTQTRERRGPGGQRVLEIFIRDQVRQTISSGEQDQVLGQRFNVRPALV